MDKWIGVDNREWDIIVNNTLPRIDSLEGVKNSRIDMIIDIVPKLLDMARSTDLKLLFDIAVESNRSLRGYRDLVPGKEKDIILAESLGETELVIDG